MFDRGESREVSVERGHRRTMLKGQRSNDRVRYQIPHCIAFQAQALNQLQMAAARANGKMMRLSNDSLDKVEGIGQRGWHRENPPIGRQP